MPGPQPVAINLDKTAHQGLLEMLRRHSSAQQLVTRARIILLAAAGKNHSQIACELGVSVDMARLWRRRWLGF